MITGLCIGAALGLVVAFFDRKRESDESWCGVDPQEWFDYE